MLVREAFGMSEMQIVQLKDVFKTELLIIWQVLIQPELPFQLSRISG